MRLPIKPINEPLYVIAVISNPRRYLSRYALYRDFEKYMLDNGAILYTVEAAFGDRDFEITSPDNPYHIQVRTSEELWIKENLINIGLGRLPIDWKYCATVDADLRWSRPDIIQETLAMLQHHDVVQMFSVAQDMNPNYEPIATYQGIFANWIKKGKPYKDYPSFTYNYASEGHPGFAFAYTRHAIDTLGGVISTALMGAADRHMCLGLLGMCEESFHPDLSEGYKHAIRTWCKRADKLKGNVGYVEGLVLHAHHGPKRCRFYNSRWKILTDHQFDPYTDIYMDSQGLWRLTGDKPKMKMDMRLYFASRNEDSTEI